MSISGKVQSLGLELPAVRPPAASFVPFVAVDSLVFISGQICQRNGERPYVGKVGGNVTVESAVDAARLCGLNILAWLIEAVGDDLSRVRRCVRLGGFVNSLSTFTDQARVISGCSNLMVDVFGDKGRHTRTSVGTNVLPFDVAVEIDAVFEVQREGLSR